MSLQAFLSGQSSNLAFQPRPLKDSFTAAVGTPVHPTRPIQNIPALKVAMAVTGGYKITMQSDDYEVIAAATEAFRRQFEQDVIRIAARFGIKKGDIQFREKPKDLGRMRTKSETEFGGDGCVHTDTNACFIFAGSADKVRALTDFLRPGNNSKVVELKEKSATPDEDTGYCANTVKYATTLNIGEFKNVPFIGEIMILAKGAAEDYAASHKQVNRIRYVNDIWRKEKLSSQYNETVQASGIAYQRFVEQQRHLNSKMAKDTGMATLKQDQTFYILNGETPFIHSKDQRGQKYDQFIVPDPRTGLFKIDNAMAAHLEEATRVSEDRFFEKAREIVPKPDYKASAFRPTLHAVA